MQDLAVLADGAKPKEAKLAPEGTYPLHEVIIEPPARADIAVSPTCISVMDHPIQRIMAPYVALVQMMQDHRAFLSG